MNVTAAIAATDSQKTGGTNKAKPIFPRSINITIRTLSWYIGYRRAWRRGSVCESSDWYGCLWLR